MRLFGGKAEDGDEYYRRQREQMVASQIAVRDVNDSAVLRAMESVPRHEFIEEKYRHDAYADGPLPISNGQTISQPFIVASMTELLRPSRDKTVFEVGTGSGYQTAILAELFGSVVTAEFFPELAEMARQTLIRLGYHNIEFHIGDALTVPGPNQRFDAIIATAAPESFPQRLANHLKPGGRMVVPVGRRQQYLQLAKRTQTGKIEIRQLYGVRFVPLLGGT